MSRRGSFTRRLRGREPLTGVFQKLPHHQVTELLGASAIGFAVLDGEHAPFDPSTIDACQLASRAVDLPLLVRVATAAPEAILAALDMGAAGVLVPHVDSAEKAATAVRAARYAGGGRGFSPSTRAGGYGTRGLRDYMEAADRENLVIGQVEDAAALECLAAIAGTPGLDAVFVGRADLAASLGCEWNDPMLDDATRAIADAAASAGIACGAYLASPGDAPRYRAWGISFLIVGSDQGILRTGAEQLALSTKGIME